MCGVEYNLQDTWELFKDDRMLHMLWQKPNINNGEYKTQFEACVTVLYSYGFYIPVHPYLLKEEMKAMKVNDMKKPGEEDNTKAWAELKEEFLTCLMIRISNNTRFISLK